MLSDQTMQYFNDLLAENFRKQQAAAKAAQIAEELERPERIRRMAEKAEAETAAYAEYMNAPPTIQSIAGGMLRGAAVLGVFAGTVATFTWICEHFDIQF